MGVSPVGLVLTVTCAPETGCPFFVTVTLTVCSSPDLRSADLTLTSTLSSLPVVLLDGEEALLLGGADAVVLAGAEVLVRAGDEAVVFDDDVVLVVEPDEALPDTGAV